MEELAEILQREIFLRSRQSTLSSFSSRASSKSHLFLCHVSGSNHFKLFLTCQRFLLTCLQSTRGAVHDDVVNPKPVKVSGSMRMYPVKREDYQLYEEVGDGVSATVFMARCIPFDEVVAIKVLDLERCRNDLEMIRREVQTMSLIEHPNVVKSYCSFSVDSSLWIVMPYMAGGSCLRIMKSSYPQGFEQPVIATLLYEVLKALDYLHSEGHIHRDVKAGNILLDTRGAVKLGDFGVSAGMFDSGDRQRSRNTFVGTPCWMAPEVMQQIGYDFKADIWSFGITALELAHGHAPFSKYPPMKVLLMTLQNAPPGLDYERDKKFSKSFRDLVAMCLLKDPKKRPTSKMLLKHSFFRHAHAHSEDFLARKIMEKLAPLGDRYKTLKENEANVLRNPAVGDDEQLSQREYILGISAWNFNIEDLRREAALIDESDSVSVKFDMSYTPIAEDDSIVPSVAGASAGNIHDFVSATSLKDSVSDQNVGTVEDMPPQSASIEVGGCSNVNVDEADQCGSRHVRMHVFEKLYASVTGDEHAPIIEESVYKEPEFQCKGRFTVIGPDTSPKDSLSTGTSSGELINSNGRQISFSSQRLMRQNSMQRDEILRLIKYVEHRTVAHTAHMELADSVTNSEQLKLSLAAARERDLPPQVMNMQQSIDKLTEELRRQKLENDQLEKQLQQWGPSSSMR